MSLSIPRLVLGLSLALAAGGRAFGESGRPAFCYVSARHGATEISFQPYCRSIEAALLHDGSFQFALDAIRRVHARLAFTALPGGEIAAAIIVKPSGDTLIDRSLISSLKTMRPALSLAHAETFTVTVALQPVDNTPGTVYRLGK